MNTEHTILMFRSNLVELANGLREKQKKLNKELWEFQCLAKQCEDFEWKGEVIANAMLSYRAGEDSRMRMGKVLQALGEESPWAA